MTSYISQLRKSKDKAAVAYQEFALSTRYFPDYLFCFFEGLDNPYYVPRIKKFISKIYPVNCGGREKVLEVFKLIRNHSVYDKYYKAFFIDRDFNQSNIHSCDSIYETPCYSIENLYVNMDVFEEILINDFQLYRSDPNFTACVELFEDLFEKFNSAILLLNSWYACLIEFKNQTHQMTGVQLDEKIPSGFITISLLDIVRNYDLEKIEQAFPDAANFDKSNLPIKLLDFENCDRKLVFRGKYQMDFFLKILQLIIDDSKTNCNIINSKIHYSFDGALNHKRALSIFSSYAATPDCLNEFLANLASRVPIL